MPAKYPCAPDWVDPRTVEWCAGVCDGVATRLMFDKPGRDHCGATAASKTMRALVAAQRPVAVPAVYTGPARDGIEAQHGLNDVYPGDDYPHPPVAV